MGARALEKTRFFNLALATVSVDALSTFDGQPLRASTNAEGFVALHNRWSIGFGLGLSTPARDDLETHDHKALLKRPPSYGFGIGFESDPTKSLVVGAGTGMSKTDTGISVDAGAGFLLVPMSRLQINLNAGLGQRNGEYKRVSDSDDKYLFARRDVTFGNAVARATLAMTRDLTLQNYSQLLIEDGS